MIQISARICFSRFILIVLLFLRLSQATKSLVANQDSRRLYDDLIGGYNRLVRPVGNNSEKLTVFMGIKLTQILDVDEKNQIMTTNVWVRQEWIDHKLRWNPDHYGGIDHLYVPSLKIWVISIRIETAKK
jgi:nicotinic acetylcholine receptor